MTKKDASGWWEAEFEGKKGLIPHNYVEVIKPPLPAARSAALSPPGASQTPLSDPAAFSSP